MIKTNHAPPPVFSLTRSLCHTERVVVVRLHQADLAIERERHLTTARAVQIPKYGQNKMESRLLRAPSSRHLKFPSCCIIHTVCPPNFALTIVVNFGELENRECFCPELSFWLLHSNWDEPPSI